VDFTHDELIEALRQTYGIIAKLDKALAGLSKTAKPQRTLAERRIKALRIAQTLMLERAGATLYEMGKQDQWGAVLSAWKSDQKLGQWCAHYAKPTSGWTFLHQAAFFGNEPVIKELIRFGASTVLQAKDGLAPVDVASSRGNESAAMVLTHATQGIGPLWAAPGDWLTLPSSCLWGEASPRRASQDMSVSYGGGVVHIREGDAYFVDSFDRILVGWHGTYDPPRGMDTESMIDDHDD
jgi:hypothetical protein